MRDWEVVGTRAATPLFGAAKVPTLLRRGWRSTCRALAVVVALLLGACGAPGTERPGGDAAMPPAEQTVLAGTAWRLVEIRSMDDSRYVPPQRDRFTLGFGADGVVQIRSDCNRGRASWASEAAGQLRLGPPALTRAACELADLAGRFERDLIYVRSFMLRDGHLFLATFADGAILEFEPAL